MTSSATETVGFVGLGAMGRHMAGNLIRAGSDVAVLNRPSLSSELRAGARVVPDLITLTTVATIIVLMLPSTHDVEKAIFGADGLINGELTGKLIIDMSSISPQSTTEFARKCEEAGCAYIDAPVSGGEIGAKAGNLSIMVGGSEDAFVRALPLLRVMGENIKHIGLLCGSGQACKVANQIIVGMGIQSVAEAFVLLGRYGVDLSKAREAMLGGFAASRVLEVHGQRMIDRAFDPGFRVALHHKDLNLALDSARDLGISLPGTEMAKNLFSRAMSLGGRDWDHSALIRVVGEPH